MKKTTIYDLKIKKIESDFEVVRSKTNRWVKSFVKDKIEALGIPCEYTQHSMYRIDGGDEYEEKYEQLKDFCYHLSDEYKIELLFQFNNGVFKWW